MTRGRAISLLVAAGAGALALGAAAPQSTLAGIKAGMWEIDGVPGTRSPARACIADVQLFTRFEHRAKKCSAKALSDDGRSVIIEYTCGGSGFGRSKLEAITPRTLKIDTQGISNALPFNYTLNARRIGDCAK